MLNLPSAPVNGTRVSPRPISICPLVQANAPIFRQGTASAVPHCAKTRAALAAEVEPFSITPLNSNFRAIFKGQLLYGSSKLPRWLHRRSSSSWRLIPRMVLKDCFSSRATKSEKRTVQFALRSRVAVFLSWLQIPKSNASRLENLRLNKLQDFSLRHGYFVEQSSAFPRNDWLNDNAIFIHQTKLCKL
jgi:hypothetical protein